MDAPVSTEMPFDVFIKKEKESLRELRHEIDQLESFDSSKVISLKEQLERKKKMIEDFEFQHLESQMDSDEDDEGMEFDVEAAELQSNGYHLDTRMNITTNNNFRNISPISERSEHDEAQIEDGFESDNGISDEILKSNSSLIGPDRPAQYQGHHSHVNPHQIQYSNASQYSSVFHLTSRNSPIDKTSTPLSTMTTTKELITNGQKPAEPVLSTSLYIKNQQLGHGTMKWIASNVTEPHRNLLNSHNTQYSPNSDDTFKVPFPPAPKEKKITFQEFVKETSTDTKNKSNWPLHEVMVNDDMDIDGQFQSDRDKGSSTRSSSMSEDSKGNSLDSSSYGQSSSMVESRNNLSKSTRPLTRYLPATDPDFDLRQHITANGHQIDNEASIQIDSNTCRGYLYKLSGKLRGWQKRWFLLDRRKKLLSYYSNPKSSKSKGHISFSDIIDVFVDHSQRAKTGHSKCTFCIETTSGRSLFLSSNSLKMMRVWIEVIFTGAEGYLSLNPYASMASLAPDEMDYSTGRPRPKY